MFLTRKATFLQNVEWVVDHLDDNSLSRSASSLSVVQHSKTSALPLCKSVASSTISTAVGRPHVTELNLCQQYRHGGLTYGRARAADDSLITQRW
jgi:hypothetical protein